eukprot:gb/GECG01004299.1/.p1 GENE.gb/GECG01004299.1/~~gb/GECG01004299.1/.p1  ORF type:complete len:509 (+),score=86.84 gb/GECG01004299.1/:1-1527(+)
MKRIRVLAVIYRLEQGHWRAYANGVWFSLTIELHEAPEPQQPPSYREIRIHGASVKGNRDGEDNTFDVRGDLANAQYYWDQVEPQKKFCALQREGAKDGSYGFYFHTLEDSDAVTNVVSLAIPPKCRPGGKEKQSGSVSGATGTAESKQAVTASESFTTSTEKKEKEGTKAEDDNVSSAAAQSSFPCDSLASEGEGSAAAQYQPATAVSRTEEDTVLQEEKQDTTYRQNSAYEEYSKTISGTATESIQSSSVTRVTHRPVVPSKSPPGDSNYEKNLTSMPSDTTVSDQLQADPVAKAYEDATTPSGGESTGFSKDRAPQKLDTTISWKQENTGGEKGAITPPSSVEHIHRVCYDFDKARFVGLPEGWEKEVSQFGTDWKTCPKKMVEGYGKIPAVLEVLRAEFLEKEGYKCEGIFRLASDKRQAVEIKRQLDSGSFDGRGTVDPYVAADLIKVWFRDQPEPLLNSLSESVIREGQSSTENAGKVITEKNALSPICTFCLALGHTTDGC